MRKAWEKIFKLGDKINQRLNLTDKDIKKEIKSMQITPNLGKSRYN